MRDYTNPTDLGGFVSLLNPDWHSRWAWEHYKPTVLSLSSVFGLTRLCEIGGGRRPLLSATEADRLGLSLTINDIDRAELDQMPEPLRTACFDIARVTDPGEIGGETYDLMFSRMVLEHVDHVPAAWANMSRLLSPGGVAFGFFPTLYALPFTINHLLPEHITGPVVRSVFPERSDTGTNPKFPARYDHCVGTERVLVPMLREAGFRDVAIVPFWGYGYFRSIPVLRALDTGFNKRAASRNWRRVTSFAYVMARK